MPTTLADRKILHFTTSQRPVDREIAHLALVYWRWYKKGAEYRASGSPITEEHLAFLRLMKSPSPEARIAGRGYYDGYRGPWEVNHE